MTEDASPEARLRISALENARLREERDALAARVAELTQERDRQYDENVHRIAEQAKAEKRAEAAEARVAELEAALARTEANRDAWMQDADSANDRVAELKAERGQDPLSDPRVKALVEAGNRMANSIKGNYIHPGSATAWDAALSALQAPDAQGS